MMLCMFSVFELGSNGVSRYLRHLDWIRRPGCILDEAAEAVVRTICRFN
jgi:hypothetical protein